MMVKSWTIYLAISQFKELFSHTRMISCYSEFWGREITSQDLLYWQYLIISQYNTQVSVFSGTKEEIGQTGWVINWRLWSNQQFVGPYANVLADGIRMKIEWMKILDGNVFCFVSLFFGVFCWSCFGLQGVRWINPISIVPWSTLKASTPHHHHPTNFALRCLVGYRTRLSCVIVGNASPLSAELLFDDGPCCTSLWFQSLQRAGQVCMWS